MWAFARPTHRYVPLASGLVSKIRPRSSPVLHVLLGFLVVYAIPVLYLRQLSSRDPTSVFFDAHGPYEPRYSLVRRRQADLFIEAVERNPTEFGAKNNAGRRSKSLCVGIPTVARHGARYFRSAVGSLLEGLSTEEREHIFLILFVAQTDPSSHPAFREGWMSAVADQVLLYNVTDDRLAGITTWEQEGGLYRQKALFDYAYLLEACSASGTPYMALLEDDIVALDGWFRRTIDGIAAAQRQTRLRYNATDCAYSFLSKPRFLLIGAVLYLRLFYTEEFLGWNKEHWKIYLVWSMTATLSILAALLTSRSRIPALRLHSSYSLIGLACGVIALLSIALYFAAGKPTVQPLPPGVNVMNKFGCCSQGLVFSRHMAQNMIRWYAEKKVGFVDVLTEEFGDAFGYVRWALTPSVLQHVGSRSSKTDGEQQAGRSVAEKIWSFAFELNDAGILRREHDKASDCC
jgi:hypothetical protein